MRKSEIVRKDGSISRKKSRITIGVNKKGKMHLFKKPDVSFANALMLKKADFKINKQKSIHL